MFQATVEEKLLKVEEVVATSFRQQFISWNYNTNFVL